MQIISNIALISINETVIVQIISFLIFLYIINRIMFKPLRGVMADRENHIKSIQQDIVSADNKGIIVKCAQGHIILNEIIDYNGNEVRFS